MVYCKQNETEEWLDPESNSTSLWITSRLDNLLGSPVFRVRKKKNRAQRKQLRKNWSSCSFFHQLLLPFGFSREKFQANRMLLLPITNRFVLAPLLACTSLFWVFFTFLSVA